MDDREKRVVGLCLLGAGIAGVAIGFSAGRYVGIQEATSYYIRGLLKIAKRKLEEEQRQREQKIRHTTT
ncbi:MAG: hypothetical protein KW788_04335 [Candidatus Doudnabacteria bacterium]|nr:hypothetical protein [Candidatus Doudnabacteria bacterium]